jgi:hypothetical protein
MEDAVYICGWSRSDAGYSVWVKSRPAIRAEGTTQDEAARRLVDAIQDAGGAMLAVLEFDSPLPKSAGAEKYSTQAIVQIGGDEHCRVLEPRNYLYQAPICRRCLNATSPRNEKPLTLVESPGSYDGASCGQIDSEIVSENFLALLTPAELKQLQLREVIRKGRKKFYEIIGPDGPPLVAVAGFAANGWRCGTCDYAAWGHNAMHADYHAFVARSDLPSPLPGIFTIGVAPDIHLAATAARWQELVGRKGTKGFISLSIGVVPDDEVVRRPELPVR